MEELSPTIIDSVRSLMPEATLNLLGRPLTEAEARIVAERQASKLLDLLGVTEPSVEIELIMELPGIKVEVIPDLQLRLHDEKTVQVSGLSAWHRDHWRIYINADDSLWRCRSTLAHELKHILDDPYNEELYPDWRLGADVPPDQAERISEYFAGCVLVPKQWLRRAWERGIRDSAKLASLFDVSQSLIEVRISQTRVDQTKTRKRLSGYSRNAYQRSASLVRSAHKRLGRQAKERAKSRQRVANKTIGGKYDQYSLRACTAFN